MPHRRMRRSLVAAAGLYWVAAFTCHVLEMRDVLCDVLLHQELTKLLEKIRTGMRRRTPAQHRTYARHTSRPHRCRCPFHLHRPSLWRADDHRRDSRAPLPDPRAAHRATSIMNTRATRSPSPPSAPHTPPSTEDARAHFLTQHVARPFEHQPAGTLTLPQPVCVAPASVNRRHDGANPSPA